jgi:hypothetical protein
MSKKLRKTRGIMQLTPAELLKLYVATHQKYYGSMPTKTFLDNMSLTRDEMVREIEYFKAGIRKTKARLGGWGED